MTSTDENPTGAQLAQSLPRGVGNEGMRAATHLLGGYCNGYWLRRLGASSPCRSERSTARPVGGNRLPWMTVPVGIEIPVDDEVIMG
ncbi:hypothetical protein ACFXKR_38010 [Streptomyces violascens]|uniref:hypothetical protein n=1 Tax=Streptomyces violascens TaxID=67381 RepID=UPI0036A18398